MTSKERFLATINFEPADRVPAYVIGGNSWIIKEDNMNYIEQFALPDAGSARIVEAFAEMNSDVINAGNSGWMAWTTAFGGEADISGVGTSISVRPAVKKYDELPLHMTYEEIREVLMKNHIVDAMLRQIRGIKAIVGDEKILNSGVTAPYTAASALLGTAPFIKMVAKRKEGLDELLDFTSTVIAVILDLYFEAGLDICIVADPVGSGDMIPLELYREFAMPAMKNMMSKRRIDKPIIIHICGKSGDRLESAIEIGAKIFSVDSMVDMEDCLKRANKQICMMGSLNPAAQMLQGTPESITEEATRLLELAKANGGGFLLSTGCDVPAGSPIENIQAMAAASEAFAKQ